MSQHDDLFRELGRTLEVSPSRDFASGVRSRIVRRRLIVRATMSGLAMAATVVFVVLVRWPEPAQPIGTLTVAPPVVATPNLAPPPVGVAVNRPAPPRQPRRVIPVAEPDRLQVVTNQMAVLRAAWAGHHATVGEMEAPVVEAPATPEPTPIVVEPVRVAPVVVADYRGNVEVMPIIRRAVAALETKPTK